MTNTNTQPKLNLNLKTSMPKARDGSIIITENTIKNKTLLLSTIL
jgi:hypothetical protein